MRNHLVAGIMLALVVAGCSAPRERASTGQAVSCANAAAPHHAYVVVEHLSGATIQRCVGFNTPTIDGQTLMDESGVQYAAHALSTGKSVCQVDNEPRQFSQCFPQNEPYWALFVESNGAWASSAGGFTDVRLKDGDAMGWHYVPAADSSPAPPPLAQPTAAGG